MTNFASAPSHVLGFALALTLGASRAAAQTLAAPPQPAPAAAPAVLQPSSAPPPSTVAPRAGATATKAVPTFAPIRAPGRASTTPPDSVRPAAPALVSEPPANAVARCTDGAFVVAPNDARACAAHGGLRVLLPGRITGPPPVAAATRAPALSNTAAPANGVAPVGATMRCKDGTYLSGAPAASRCDGFGGVAAVLVAPPTLPPPPRPRRP